MVRKGIITGATVQMNFSKFGYDALATFLINVESNQLDKVMSYIGKMTEVRAYRQYNSVYNIRAVAILRDLNQLDHFKQAIKRMLPTMGLRTYLWTDTRNIPENLSLNYPLEKMSQKSVFCLAAGEHKCLQPLKIDDLDKQIIKKLTIDGRASFVEIAKELETSIDTVVKRYHKLKNDGVIKVSIQIDPNKIGYTSILDFNISFTCAQDLSSTVIESLAKINDVIIITKISGDYDLQLTAMIKNVEQSFAIQDQIARTCGITKIEVNARKIPTKWPTALQHISTI